MPGGPRSQSKQHKKQKKLLSQRIKKLAILSAKHLHNAENITLNHVSLGQLRNQFQRRHYKTLPPLWQEIVAKFARYASSPDTPLLIYGSDGGLLAARVHLKRPDLVAKLAESIDALPEAIKCYKFKGIKRSQYQKRHYGHWCPYMPTPQLTAEHRRDGTIADNFINQAQPLFHDMSAVLGGLLPQLFKDMKLFPVPGTVERMCGA